MLETFMAATYRDGSLFGVALEPVSPELLHSTVAKACEYLMGKAKQFGYHVSQTGAWALVNGKLDISIEVIDQDMIKAAFRHIPEENAERVLRILDEHHADNADRSVRAVEARMQELNKLTDCHGVECIKDSNQKVRAEYINSGDAYTATILYDCDTQRMDLTTYGDWVEENEDKYDLN